MCPHPQRPSLREALKRALLVGLGTVFVGCGSYKSTSVRDVTLLISVPKKSVLGDPIVATFTLTNAGKDTITIGTVDGTQELGIAIADRQGKGLGATNSNGTNQISGFVPISPGDTHTWEVDLSKLYRFSPGTYSLSSRVHTIDRNLVLEVTDVTFEVVSR